MAGSGKDLGRRSDPQVREDAYPRIALRLRDLGAEDRKWLLSRLGAEDCQRVSVALQEYRARNAAEPALTPVVPREVPNTSVESAASPTARLAAASATDVNRLFAEQPDWAIALVLSAGPWPWTQEVLGQWAPERIQALRALAGELSERVKPQFREAVVRAIALDLAPDKTETPVTQAFDAALQRAVRELSVVESWKLELS